MSGVEEAVAQAAAPAALECDAGFAAVSAASAAAALLAACGGGGDAAVAPDGTAAPQSVPRADASAASAAAVAPTRAQASRFLSQASLSCSAVDIASVQALGFSGWLDAQMALLPSQSRVDWLRSKGYDAAAYRNTQGGANNMLWRKLVASPDVLRQRVALALSEIIVINVSGLTGGFKAFAAAALMDILEANAFGNYRTLIEQVSTSPAMGAYLTFRGNRKASGLSLPDENYAREVMQLFTIGLVKLNPDGTLQGGIVQETYDQPTVSEMARVFTGWDYDTSVGSADTPDKVIRPMVQFPIRHELGKKDLTKLGLVIPPGTDGVQSLKLTLDALIKHPNAAPFISRQLIQRLVTSNPSKEYVGRVAAAFASTDAGGPGNLRAVFRAILLDDEARSDAGLTNPAFGKLREPVVRFLQWARSFGLHSPDDSWNLGDMSDPATRLGQSPLRSPSVFNFFRPGYVPPNSPIGNRTVPEFQITTESSVAGYVNFMQLVVAGRSVAAGMTLDYAALRPLVADSAALLAELNVLLAAGQLSAATLAQLKPALDGIPVTTATGQNNRLYAALLFVLAAPEYITLK